MQTRPFRSLIVILGAAILWPLFAHGQETNSLKEVIEKNLQASGGREKLAQIRNISFRAGEAFVTASSSFELRILAGKGPVPGEVILVSGDRVRRSASGQSEGITGIPMALNQTLARLYGGVFTLLGFEGRLEFHGTKAFGPEKFYHLTAKMDPLELGFFLRAEDHVLRRLVFQGQTTEGDKYEVNYDFSSFEEAEGIKLPLTWFRSQVGTRGSLVEVTEIKINQPLDKDFFSKVDAGGLSTRPSRQGPVGLILD